MATLVELEIPADRLGFARTFDRAPSFEFHVGGMAGSGPPLVWVTGDDHAAITDALEADPSVSVLASLTSNGNQWVYRLELDGGVKLFEQLVLENDGAVLESNGQSGAWSITLLFHDQRAVSSCHDLLLAYDFACTVRRVSSVEDVSSGRLQLTETQYETVCAAHELGYFDVPRKVTLKELAAELDVSHQALSERLRRSHAALVSGALENRMDPPRVGR